jgi:hypothetical protein
VAADPERHSGVGSDVKNFVARPPAVVAVAVLAAGAGITDAAYVHPPQFAAGFHTAAAICAALCVFAGGLAAATVKNGNRPLGASTGQPMHPRHGQLDIPPPRSAHPRPDAHR